MPEDTRLPAIRGAIGMRRTQKRHDSKGLVGSQFRISKYLNYLSNRNKILVGLDYLLPFFISVLQDMPGFTGIFGHILEGIEIVDKISECGKNNAPPLRQSN